MGILPTDDIVTLLAQDHEAVSQRLSELDAAPAEARAELFWELVNQLVRHEVAEESVVYPALRKGPGGDAVADARQAEEAAAERLLAHMETLDPTSAEFLGAVEDLRSAVLEHAAKEEAEVFPLLLANEDPDSLARLGQKFKGEKLAAPSHPHPHTPNSALGHKVVGPIAAFIDHIRDGAREHSS
jgi:iron-sulfur cluster repair protein YtfE (RIC family)